jgi:hypothetical protein
MFRNDRSFTENVDQILLGLKDKTLAEIIREHSNDIVHLSKANSAQNREKIIQSISDLIENRVRKEVDENATAED